MFRLPKCPTIGIQPHDHIHIKFLLVNTILNNDVSANVMQKSESTCASVRNVSGLRLTSLYGMRFIIQKQLNQEMQALRAAVSHNIFHFHVFTTRNSLVDEVGERYHLNHATLVKRYHPYTQFPRNVRLHYPRIATFPLRCIH